MTKTKTKTAALSTISRVVADGLKGSRFSLENLDTRATVVVGKNGEGKSARVFSIATALEKPPAMREGRGGVPAFLGDELVDVVDPKTGRLEVSLEGKTPDGEDLSILRVYGRTKKPLAVGVAGVGIPKKGEAEKKISEIFGRESGRPVDLAAFASITPTRQRAELERVAGAAVDLDTTKVLGKALESRLVDWEDDAGETHERNLSEAEIRSALEGPGTASEFVDAVRARYREIFTAKNRAVEDARGARNRLLESQSAPAEGDVGRASDVKDRIARLERERDTTRDELVAARSSARTEVDRDEARRLAEGQRDAAKEDVSRAAERLENAEAAIRKTEEELEGLASTEDFDPAPYQKAIDAAVAEVVKVSENLDAARGILQAAEVALSTHSARREDLEASVSALQSSEACPLCGTTGDAFQAASSALAEKLGELSAAELELDVDVDEARDSFEAQQADLERASSHADHYRKELGRAEHSASVDAHKRIALSDAKTRAERDRDEATRAAGEARERLEVRNRELDSLDSAPATSSVVDTKPIEEKLSAIEAGLASAKEELERFNRRDRVEELLSENLLELSKALEERAVVKAIQGEIESLAGEILRQTLGPIEERANRYVAPAYAGRQRFAFRPAGHGESAWGFGLFEETARRPGEEPRGWRPFSALSKSERIACGLGLELARRSFDTTSGFRPVILEHLESVDEDVVGRLLSVLSKELVDGELSCVLVEWKGEPGDWTIRVAPHIAKGSAVRVINAEADSAGSPVFFDHE